MSAKRVLDLDSLNDDIEYRPTKRMKISHYIAMIYMFMYSI